MNEFEKELLEKLIVSLNLEDVDPEDIDGDTTLFGDGGLELDSIDAIEIEVMVKAEYGIDILKSERNQATFGTFSSLASFVKENQDRDV